MVMNGQDVSYHHEGNDKDQVAIIKKTKQNKTFIRRFTVRVEKNKYLYFKRHIKIIIGIKYITKMFIGNTLFALFLLVTSNC